MAEQLHKGWLNTRDNEKFAPATLATQIYNENGTSFYTTVSNYIQAQEALAEAVEQLASVDVVDLKADLQAETEARAAKDQELEGRLQYFNGDVDNALYIIDNSANVIAYVDGSGVNSTDFTIPTSGIRLSNVAAHVNDLQDSVEDILTKLAYFDGAADNAFFIVDNNKNVIAYIDGSGVHSTNFFTTETDFNSLVARINAIETTDLSAINEAIERLQATDDALSNSVETLTNRLSYFNGDADDTFYIIDKDKNVIAYIKEGGVYSVDFHPKDGRSVKELDAVLATHQTEFNTYKSQQASLDAQQDSSIDALGDSVETLTNRLSYFNGDADDAFYIIDKDKNVIAYIKEGGVYSVDFIPNEGRTHKELDEAFDTHAEQYVEDKETQAETDTRQNESISALSDSIEKLSTYFNADADDTFYIIDKDKNVIAYIRDGGVYSTNFTLKDGRNLVTLYDDYERILANAETYNTFDIIETWIEGAIETLRAHGESIGALGDSIEAVVAAVGLPSDDADYPGYDDTPANLYEAVIENRADINILNGAVTQEGSVAKAIDDLHKEILGGASADYQTLKKVETAIEDAKDRLDVAEGEIDAIQELIGESSDSTDTTLLGKININAQNIASNDEDISELQQNTQYFNGAADDALYIVDQSEDQNVIAVINGQGVKSIDFTTPEAGLNATAASLAALTDVVEDLGDKVGIPEEPDYKDPDGSLYDQVIQNKEDIAILNGDASTPGSVKKAISDLVGDATTYKTLGRIEDEIGLNYTAGENTVKGKIQTNAENIATLVDDVIGDYPTSKHEPTKIPFPVSKSIYWLIEANWQEIQTLIADEGTPGSVAYKIAQVVANAPEAYDTLAEIAAWIEAHPTDVAAMWAQINKNKSDIEAIFGEIGEKTIDAGQTIHQRIDDNDADIDQLEEKVQYFNGSGDDTLYIVDNTTDHNIIAYIDKTGIHAINFTSHQSALDPETNTALELENFNNLVARVGQAEDDISALEQVVESHIADAATDDELEAVRQGLQGQIDTINTGIGSDTTVGSIKGRIKAIEGEIGTNTTVGSIKYRVTTAEGAIDALEGTSEDHTKRISALEKDATDNPKALQSDFKDLYDQVNTGDNSLVNQIANNDVDILALQTNSATKTELQALSDALETHKGEAATDAEVEVIRSNLQSQINNINTEIGDSSTAGRTIWPAIEKIESWAGDLDATGTVTGRLDTVEDKADANADAIGEATDAIGTETVYGRINAINNKIKYFDGNADTAFYIIDKDSNVIAYINESGLVTRNVHLQYYDKDGKLVTYPHLEQLAQWIGLEDDTIDNDTIFGRLLKAEKNIEALSDTDESIIGKLGIDNPPNYKNPKTNAVLDPQTLYAQVMVNQAAIYDIYKENGELDSLENRLLYTDPDNKPNTLNYTSIESIGETLGLSSETTTAGSTVFGKIETLRASNQANEDALGALGGEIGIPSEEEGGPDYADPNPHKDEDDEKITTLYGQVIANKTQLAELVKDEGILEQLEERLLGVPIEAGEGTDKADLEYQTIFALNDIIGPTAGVTDVAGNTVFEKIETLDDKIDAVNGLIGDYPSTADGKFPSDKKIYELIETNYDNLAVLMADSSTSGSVAWQIAQVVAGADASYDTLKEISDWILTNPEGASAMWTQIRENKGKITDILGVIGGRTEDPMVDGSDTLWSNIEDINRVFNNDSDDTIYVVDKSNNKNVVAYFNQSGLTTTNVIMSNTTLDHSIRGLGYNETEAQKSENIITFDFDI